MGAERLLTLEIFGTKENANCVFRFWHIKDEKTDLESRIKSIFRCQADHGMKL